MKEGYNISRKEKEIFEKRGYAPTYGELTKDGIKDLLDNIDTKEKVFADLGSGTGNVVMYVKELYPDMFGYVGIEYSPTRHKIAQKKRKALKQDKSNVYFINDDITNDKLLYTDYDIIYVSNLCFTSLVSNKIGEKIAKECKPGTHIFCSKPLNLDKSCNCKINNTNVKQTWSESSKVICYEIV